MLKCMALSFLLLASGAVAQLTEEQLKAIDEGLAIANLTRDDFNYVRRSLDSIYLSDTNKDWIEKPFLGIDALKKLGAQASRMSFSGQLSSATQMLGLPLPSVNPVPVTGIKIPADVPAELHGPITALIQSLSVANMRVRQAQNGLSAEDVRALIEGLPRLAVGSDAIEFEFVKSKPSFTELRELVRRTNARERIGSILVGAKELAAAVDAQIPNLMRIAKATKWEGYVKFRAADQVVVIAGVGDDVHRDRDARLVIDLGGNDRYYGRHGAGIGYAALAIDLGGDDFAKLPDAGAGCGIFGIGLAYDFGGHDFYRSKSLALGSGLLGVGGFFKDGGDDNYRSEALSQGFGFLGAGLFLDTRGDDNYQLGLLGQGAGRPLGVGWLNDMAGNDTYRSGGIMVHAPLFKDATKSCAQGFGGGLEMDTSLVGGFGLLTDASGTDAYVGETLAQGVGVDQGVGALLDGKGNDTYRAYHFSQGYGADSGAGYLMDESGDDSYIVNFGASHALGQNYGSGVLIDTDGNDVYAGRESRPGSGNANGSGLFIDFNGEDRYAGPPGTATVTRQIGSLGVFLDFGGPDQYLSGLSDAQANLVKSIGLAYDRESSGSHLAADPPVNPPTPGSVAVGSENEVLNLFKDALSSDSQVATLAIHRLIGMGLPAVRILSEKRMTDLTPMERSVLGMVADAVGQDGRLTIAMKISSPNKEIAQNALMICSEIEAVEAGPYIPGALDVPELSRLAIEAAGRTRSRDSVEKLVPLGASPDKWIARAVMVSLAQIGDPRALGNAQAQLNSPDLLTRQTAISMVAQSTEGLNLAKAMIMANASEREVRTGIEILSQIGSPEALKEIGQKLLDDRPGVRISCLVALNGRAPQEFRAQILERRRDPDARVRAVAARIDPGR